MVVVEGGGGGRGRADNPLGDRSLIVNENFTTLIMYLKFQLLLFKRFENNDFLTLEDLESSML